jgi:hypothetical protein
MTAAVPAIPTWVRRLGAPAAAVARGLFRWLMEYIVIAKSNGRYLLCIDIADEENGIFDGEDFLDVKITSYGDD